VLRTAKQGSDGVKHETEVALIRRILGQAGSGARDEANGERRVPISDYLSPERYHQEMAVFRRFPIVVGPASELPGPGSVLAHDATGVPLVLTRGESGQVSAFLNVCRHRGSRIVVERRGRTARSLVCPYHGWTYGLDGRLAAISDPASFPGVDKASHGLVRVPAAERFGLLWVKPKAGDDALDIDGYLGPLAEDFAAFGLERSVVYAPENIRCAMNWKLLVGTFLEDYHFRFVHGRSVYRFYLDNASVYERFGPHVRYVIPKRTILDLKGVDESKWRLRDHSNILYFVFPNTVMVFVADHAALFAMFPDGQEKAVMELSFCLPEVPSGEKAEAYWKRNAELIRTALSEDFRMAEGVQSGLASGANRELVFGRYEKGLHYFHDALDEAVQGRG
jgi:phenylpropionate dioxygenase-like ring-hydroxylating dioxygenase large terminal subunit